MKFSKLTSQQLYGRQWGELLMRSRELKGNSHSASLYQGAWMSTCKIHQECPTKC